MRITLVHNPQAGEGRHSGKTLQGRLEQQGYRVTLQSIKQDGFESTLAEPGDFVVVAGGDGAVGTVAKCLAGRGVPIAILPLGTANNIARTLGIDGSPEQTIAGISAAERQPFDLGVMQGPELDSRFLEAVGMGLFTEAMCMIKSGEEPDGKHEKFVRDCRFLSLLSRDFPAQHYTVTADGDDLSGEYILCEVLNIRSIGPGLCLAPEADPADGLLDVVLVGEAERGRLRDYLTARCAGEDSPPEFPARRASQVRISAGMGGVRVDDEIERAAGISASRLFRQGGVVVGVERHVLEFLVPVRRHAGSPAG
jgi:diacylglycerol kinase family enzyme